MAAAASLDSFAFRVDEAAWAKLGSRVLMLNAMTPGPESELARRNSKALLETIQSVDPDLQVDVLDLWSDAVQDSLRLRQKELEALQRAKAGGGCAEDQKSVASLKEHAYKLATASGLIISTGVWNAGLPYVVKQYFDAVMHPGWTYYFASDGRREALFGGGRPLVLLLEEDSSGSTHSCSSWLQSTAASAGFDRFGAILQCPRSVPSISPSPALEARIRRLRQDLAGTVDCFVRAVGEVRREVQGHPARGSPGPAEALLEGSHHVSAGTATALCSAAGSAFACSEALLGSGGDSSSTAAPAPAAAAPTELGQEARKGKEEEDIERLVTPEGLLAWLQRQGGLSTDALETVEAMRIDGQMFLQATEADWQTEEYPLEDEDAVRVLELQSQYRSLVGEGFFAPMES